MMAFMAIVLAGIGTYVSRSLFIVLLAERQFPPLALQALEYVAPCVMAALIVSMLTTADGQVAIGPPELVGILAAAVVVARTRNHFYGLVAAMSLFWILRAMSYS
ncbi:MAG: AzlD domain-containing protein [Pseudomonadota bacterium]